MPVNFFAPAGIRANFFLPTEQPDPVKSYREYDRAVTELDVIITRIKNDRHALIEAIEREYETNQQSARDQSEEKSNELPIPFSPAKKRQLLRIMVETLKCFKDQVFHDAHHTFKDDPAGTARLAHNIRQVNLAITEVLNHPNDLSKQIAAIDNLQYKASRWEPTFTTLKKIVRVLIAAAVGFVMGAIAGTTLSGGISALPTAILLNFKNTIAAYATGGAGAAAAIGPSLAAAISARDEISQKTNSPVERRMLSIQRSLRDTLEPPPAPRDILTKVRGFFNRQETIIIHCDHPENRQSSLAHR